MKRIICVLKPFRLEAVLSALDGLELEHLEFGECRGYGRQKGQSETHAGREYAISFLPKVRVEILAEDEVVEPIVARISEAASTGRIGDGKIFIAPVDGVVD
ncbi:MAG: P-II family nitrogen regulator [Planctomycetota bacterium]